MSKTLNMATDMKIKKKPIESIRIRPDRAELLKDKAFEISMLSKEIITESELVNYLIDEYVEKITVKNGELKIEQEK